MVSCENCRHYSASRDLCTFTGSETWPHGCTFYEEKADKTCTKCKSFISDGMLCRIIGKKASEMKKPCKWFRDLNDPQYEWRD